MSENGQLGELEVAIYRALLAVPGRTQPQLAAQLERPVGDLDKPVAALLDMGLLRSGADESLVAISPMLAEATVLGVEDLELGARRASIEARRNAIRSLVPDWNSTLNPQVQESAVDVISDQSAIANVLMHHAYRCENELLSVAPGRLPTTRIDGRTRIANIYSLRRGIKTRALYQHSALRDRACLGASRSLAGSVAGSGTTGVASRVSGVNVGWAYGSRYRAGAGMANAGISSQPTLAQGNETCPQSSLTAKRSSNRSAGIGAPNRKPCMCEQPASRRKALCTSVSTPSAITSLFRLRAMPMIARVMAAVSASCVMSRTKARSIFRASTGKCLR